MSVADAAALVQSNTRVFSAGWAGDPHTLIDALGARQNELENVEFCSNNSLALSFNRPQNTGHILNNQWFVGAGARKEVQAGRGTYTVHHFGNMERDMNGLPIQYGMILVFPLSGRSVRLRDRAGQPEYALHLRRHAGPCFGGRCDL